MPKLTTPFGVAGGSGTGTGSSGTGSGTVATQLTLPASGNIAKGDLVSLVRVAGKLKATTLPHTDLKANVYAGDAITLNFPSARDDVTSMVGTSDGGAWIFDFFGTTKYARKINKYGQPAGDWIAPAALQGAGIAGLFGAYRPMAVRIADRIVLIARNAGNYALHFVLNETDLSQVYAPTTYSNIALTSLTPTQCRLLEHQGRAYFITTSPSGTTVQAYAIDPTTGLVVVPLTTLYSFGGNQSLFDVVSDGTYLYMADNRYNTAANYLRKLNSDLGSVAVSTGSLVFGAISQFVKPSISVDVSGRLYVLIRDTAGCQVQIFDGSFALLKKYTELFAYGVVAKQDTGIELLAYPGGYRSSLITFDGAVTPIDSSNVSLKPPIAESYVFHPEGFSVIRTADNGWLVVTNSPAALVKVGGSKRLTGVIGIASAAAADGQSVTVDRSGSVTTALTDDFLVPSDGHPMGLNAAVAGGHISVYKD